MDKLNLNDVGTVRSVDIPYYGHMKPIQVHVIMGIKAPKGRMFLFGKGYMDDKVEAIKAFMEEHTNG